MARLHRNLRNGNILSSANSAWLKKKQLSGSIVKMYKKTYLLPNEFDGARTAKPFACFESDIKAKLLQSIYLQNWGRYYHPTWYFVIEKLLFPLLYVTFHFCHLMAINISKYLIWPPWPNGHCPMRPTPIFTDPAANYPLGWRAEKLFNGATNLYIFHIDSCQYLANI